MKIIKQFKIEGKEVLLANPDPNIILELNTAGRGFVVIKSNNSELKGKDVSFHLGEYDRLFNWFIGIIENAEPYGNGFQKLFIREKSSIFEKQLNCSLRHVTLKELGAWINSKTNLDIKIPDTKYSTKKIPHFTHNGTGYQLLANIGRSFQIPMYIWQQTADGSIFIGSHNDSRWSGKQIELDHRIALSTSNNEMVIPITASIRPGAIINGNRINKVELDEDNYILTWENLDENGKPQHKTAIQKQVEKHFPELEGGYHLPKFAKVVAVGDAPQGGEISTLFRAYYAVDLQLLDDNYKEDKTVPIYKAVPLPVHGVSSQGGDFCFPEVGTLCEIGFAYGRPDKPFIRATFPQFKTLPKLAIGDRLLQQRPEVYERTDSVGNKIRETDQDILDKSFTRHIETDDETREIGTTTTNVDADSSLSVGGNHSVTVAGNITEVTGSNKTLAVSSDLSEQIKGIATRISDTKQMLQAPTIKIGNGKNDVLEILNALIGIVADIAQISASHTHGSSPPPNESGAFSSKNKAAKNEGSKLSEML